MITVCQKVIALLALAVCVASATDVDEQDALIRAVFKAITGQQPQETEEHNDRNQKPIYQ